MPINIFDLLSEKEKEENKIRKQEIELMNKTCDYIYMSHRDGFANEEIERQLKKLNLPMSIHLAVFGRFSEICKYGRILTSKERKILSM